MKKHNGSEDKRDEEKSNGGRQRARTAAKDDVGDDERRSSRSKNRKAKLAVARRRWASLFRDVMRATRHLRRKGAAYQPRCDVQEADELTLVSVDLPGVVEESINVQVENWNLTVRGRRARREHSQQDTGESARRAARV